MRKLSFFLLLATAAAPALAAPDNDRGGRHHGNEASEQSDSRPQRSREARGSENREQHQFGAQRSERAQPNFQGTTERIREHYQQQHEQAVAVQPTDSVRSFRSRERQGTTIQTQAQTDWRARERRVRTIPDTQPDVTRSTREQREAFVARRHRDYNGGNYTRWTNNWRNDHRYDWQRWRDRNRSSFHIGFYYDPFGYNYRRWSIGSFLFPSYYSSNYWLDDPWQYRLPPAYGPYRWVRYWDDALLVNIYTGEVEDVIHNFFW